MLPTLLPMLATPALPFDGPQYSFEVKWNGVRMLAAVETVGCRLWGRDAADYTARYPELAVLRRLPPGTLVDGGRAPAERSELAAVQQVVASRGRAQIPQDEVFRHAVVQLSHEDLLVKRKDSPESGARV